MSDKTMNLRTTTMLQTLLLFTALLLPPVPLLLAILIGVWFMRRRPRGAASLVVVSLAQFSVAWL